MHLARHPRARWRPVVRFADAPTAAIAVVATRPVRIARDTAAELAGRDRDGDLVPPVPNDRLVPADFSEQVALTSPIPLPRAHQLQPRPHRAESPSGGRDGTPFTGPVPRQAAG
jgi:hypothetical protein